MQRIPEYTGELLDGMGVRHKDDRRNLEMGQVDLVRGDGEVAPRGISAILQRVPPLADCARQVAVLIEKKTEKLRETERRLTHINLVIRDNTHLLARLPVAA